MITVSESDDDDDDNDRNTGVSTVDVLIKGMLGDDVFVEREPVSNVCNVIGNMVAKSSVEFDDITF